jgi:dATP pyrophosphohydrolase
MAEVVSRYVEVCIFRFEGDHAEFLLLHRQPEERVYPNTWQFVTGTVDGGESALAAAQRELREETGFVPKGFWVLPCINSFYDSRQDLVHLNPVFAAQVEPGAIPRLSQEHDLYEWVTREKALQKLLWQGQQEALDLVQRSIIRGEEVMRISRII